MAVVLTTTSVTTAAAVAMKFNKTKNGRQVYQTLHAVLLGGEQITSTGSAIVTKLQSFRYEYDRKNFTFDKK